MNFKNYTNIISIGCNCRTASALKDLEYRKFSAPLDWTLSTTKSVYKAFEDEFKNFYDVNNCEDYICPATKYKCIFNKKYRINITHETKINEQEILKYERRCSKLVTALKKNKKILLVRNLLDCEILDKVHEQYLKTEKSNDINCNNIDWLYKLESLLNKKYKNTLVNIVVIYYSDSTIIDRNKKNIFYLKAEKRSSPVDWDLQSITQCIKKA